MNEEEMEEIREEAQTIKLGICPECGERDLGVRSCQNCGYILK